MPVPESQSRHFEPPEDVLTLAEAASYLRVPAEAVSELVAKRAIPAQEIGSEWRFSKRALAEWLRFGPHYYDGFPLPWMLNHPMWEDFCHLLARRILSFIPVPEQPPAAPGSKKAVLKHFGVFQDDADLEKQLAGFHARREAASE
jgi:excisionase family DNA binding protein